MNVTRSSLIALNADSAVDEIDRAGVVTMINEADAMARQTNKRQRPLPPDFDGKNCYECGEKINPKRIDAMKYTIDASENVRPHPTDVVSRDKKSTIKHGTELCIECAKIADVRSRQFH